MDVLKLRKKRDIYTKKAKSEGYRSRAAYKLLQIDKKFRIFHEKQLIIDLCGAPGGFSQIARDRTKGKACIFLVDLARIKKIPKITAIIQGDITKLNTIQILRQHIEQAKCENYEVVVLADCSPNVSGNWATDHARQIWLSEVAAGIANYFLAEKFVTKVFQGEYLADFLEILHNYYVNISEFKPETSRKRSAEMYVVAMNRKGNLNLHDENCLVLEEE